MNRMTVSAEGDSTRPVENDGRQLGGCGEMFGYGRGEEKPARRGMSVDGDDRTGWSGCKTSQAQGVSVYG
jgi:hypothetical protein